MKKNTAIPNSIILLLRLVILTECKKSKCYKCTMFYEASYCFNPATNDKIVLSTFSKSHGIDSLEKYFRLGYIPVNSGTAKNVEELSCDEDLNKLSQYGINYNCQY